jgi:predicted nucleic acid-binding protein
VILVHTNILVYLLIESDRTSSVQDLFARDSEWCSEAFLMVEFSNVLATYVRMGALRRAQSAELLTEAQATLAATHNVAHGYALEAAMEHQISAYDARFISLAKQLKMRLTTEDAKLCTAVPMWTISLSDALS